jgi:hypothetical protein
MLILYAACSIAQTILFTCVGTRALLPSCPLLLHSNAMQSIASVDVDVDGDCACECELIKPMYYFVCFYASHTEPCAAT